jgi:hypothetical protein
VERTEFSVAIATPSERIAELDAECKRRCGKTLGGSRALSPALILADQ